MSVVDDAALAASLFAVDPAGIGGICLRSQIQPARDQWLRLLREILPADSPFKRIPFNIGDGRLLGGLDLTATLKANRPIADQGVLAASDGGVVIVAMAERLSAHTAACLNAVLDLGEVILLREAVSGQAPARIGIVALDEGIGAEETIPQALLDRLAFVLDFDGLTSRASFIPLHDWEDIYAARCRLATVRFTDDIVERLCGTALALGVESPRVSWLAMQVARAAAALGGRSLVDEDDAVIAGRLVLAPRATLPPRSDAADPQGAPTPPESETREEPQSQPLEPESRSQTEDKVLAASRAAIPAGLLARLTAAEVARGRSGDAGRAGVRQAGLGRGRPIGTRAGAPRANARLNVLETLRAAAPWQSLRGRRLEDRSRLRIHSSDFRITTCKQRSRTLTIFVVDASGSAALNRLAEAKGAVELLLAECYIRRDQVAVISFRGRSAELMLPPTRSLVRAKRGLAGMPGGGATPLAAALTMAATLARQSQHRGETPNVVLLTDGRANVARDGGTGREQAHRDALAAAAAFRESQIKSLMIDTSPRPNTIAHALAMAMNAHYVPLPFATSRGLSDVVKAAAGGRTSA